MKRKVTFIIDQNRYESEFHSELLSLGNLVHVSFSQEAQPTSFYPSTVGGSVPYCIEWIAPSDWTVWLANSIEIRRELIDQTIKMCKGLLPSEAIETALQRMSKRFCLKDLFKTSEYLRNEIATVQTVIDRLDLCEALADPVVEKRLFAHLRPLRIYLYLTCFDKLGQPADWLDFGSWIKSRKHAHERQKAIEGASSGLPSEQITQKYYEHYNKIYGVKSSFYRFINEVLPSLIREKLLSSIRIDKSPFPPSTDNYPSGNDDEKKKFLFETRNNYTHKALYVPGIGRSLSPIPQIKGWFLYTQEVPHDYLMSVFIWNWPEILEECIKTGMSSLLNRSLNNTDSK